MLDSSSPFNKNLKELREYKVRTRGSCGATETNTKGCLYFKLQTVEGCRIPVHPELLRVTKLGADRFSFGTLEEKGIRSKLICDPPVLEFGDETFPVSKEMKRMFIPSVIIANNKGEVFASAQDESEIWHRRLEHCNIKKPQATRGTRKNWK